MDDLSTVKRLHYFDHQFLRANDFTDEQSYHLTLRRLHNQLLHSWGIADGLDVSFQGGATSVTVASGVAMDSLGREIILPTDQTVELASYPADKDVYLTIAYDEQETDETVETGAAGKTRTTEQPKFAPLQNAPGDPGQQIMLAIVKRTGTEVTNLDKSGRRAAGAAGGSLDVLGLGFRDPSIVSTGWVRMRLEAANRSLLQGSLHISDALTADGDVTIDGKLTVTGPLAVGAATANAPLDVRGQGRMGSLAVTDGSGNPFADGWIGMANNLDGSSKWLHLGGITDGGQRRVALVGSRIYVTGALGIGTPQPAQSLHSTGNAIINNAFLGDVGHGANWAAFSHSSMRSTTTYGLLQSVDGLWTLINKKSGGGGIQLRVDNTDRITMLDNGNLGIGAGLTNPAARLQVAGGAIMPALGNASNAGIYFPPNPGGGAGDEAFIRYYVVSGEATTLLIGNQNDADDRISFYQFGGERLTLYNGMVGIGTTSPENQLSVVGGGTGIRQNRLYLSGGTAAAPWSSLSFNAYHNESNTGWVWPEPTRPAVTLEMDANPAGRFQVYGTTRANPTGWNLLLSIESETGNLWVRGGISAGGGKGGYVTEQFVNAFGDSLEQGDVVVIGGSDASLTFGVGDAIPIPEADIAQEAYDTRVCGIVAEVHGEVTRKAQAETAPGMAAPRPRRARGQRARPEPTPRAFTTDELGELRREEVKPGQIGAMVTLGAYAHCKVDAKYGAIQVGDLLTTSPTKGHAQKVTEPGKAVGAIIGKALGSREKGRGKIPVLVMLQ